MSDAIFLSIFHLLLFTSRSATMAISMTECKEDCHRSINFPSKYAQKVWCVKLFHKSGK